MEKKSNNRAVGNLPLLAKIKKAIIPPIAPPVSVNPGKYGNKKNTNGFKKLELGFKTINKTLELIKENIATRKAMLKTFSVDTSFRSKTKSSFAKRYKQNKNIKKQVTSTKIKNCII